MTKKLEKMQMFLCITITLSYNSILYIGYFPVEIYIESIKQQSQKNKIRSIMFIIKVPSGTVVVTHLFVKK